MFLLIVFFLVSIIFSFLCSVWEAVLLSVTNTFVEVEQQKGTKTGQLLSEFKENIDRPLAAILTLNTIAHTVGAIGVGAMATKVWPDSPMSTIVVPVVMTLAILILSEIIPKTFGANYWKSLAGFTTRSINFIILLLYPLVWFSQLITKFLKKDKDASVLSRADFATMAKLAGSKGVMKNQESRIVENLMKFNKIEAKDIMTPRTVMKSSKEETTIQEFFDANPKLRFSRIPVYKETKDNITGFFLKDDLLTALITKKGDQALKSIMREIVVVNENMLILNLFDQLMEKKNHIALVVDEYGGTAGLVTMEDVIETLLGMEIVDEFDNADDMQAFARKKWEERAKGLGLLETNGDQASDQATVSK